MRQPRLFSDKQAGARPREGTPPAYISRKGLPVRVRVALVVAVDAAGHARRGPPNHQNAALVVAFNLLALDV